ncbi:hypothetical protein TW85_00310 [Marinomonas sp. S3726]|uniref:LON peptidase substrate-binding domain-containing protein n=1 Tax=Marinomonas sp. S3726 TaxID=579484 RepID=UPI0005F9B770|nr:LON peptidase substrate-binding domain-containing protein [Marinomonas sp. S3726]KJZ16257.1 hypothetical protein TW85_00310 [Marinomonas sp. S3726]
MLTPQLTNSSVPITDMPIFPLHVFLLPKGRQKLRIFEAKYLTMVMASLESRGFVIAFPNPVKNDTEVQESNTPVSHWGTLVKVVDFDQGDDGVLLIDVEGEFLVSLQSFHYQDDGLLLGDCLPRPHWPTSSISEPVPPKPILVATLKELFYQYQDLNLLYPIPHFESAHWVNARLLEVLPVPHKVKAHFIQPDSLSSLTTFLTTYIQGNNS